MSGNTTSKKILKPSKKRIFFGLLKNDLEFLDLNVLREKIHNQSHFSVLYFILLIASVLICTIGLLTNSSAIVIGGMLIAPLMWPLARLGYGIAHRSPRHLYRGALLVLASILIGAISAYFITSISPIKTINDEILARTSPTLMDLFVALAAGFVAAIAITQRKIADSLAGVAIAVSLMPPLCTVGIALSLRNISYSLGALLLFAVNAACITLVTTLVLVYTQYARTKKVHIAKRAAAFNIILVLFLSIPLIQLLRNYTFEVQSYSVISEEMTNYIENKDSASAFENIQIKQTNKSTINVGADLLIPSDLSFTYEDNEMLINRLENRLQKKILLNLRIQSIIEPISKNQKDSEQKIDLLRKRFSEEMLTIESSFKINSISIAKIEDGWTITSDVLIAPDTAPTSKEVSAISEIMSKEFSEKIDLNLTFVPRLTLRSSEQTVSEEVKKLIQSLTSLSAPRAVINDYSLIEENSKYIVDYTIVTSNVEVFSVENLQNVKLQLQLILESSVDIRVRVQQVNDIQL